MKRNLISFCLVKWNVWFDEWCCWPLNQNQRFCMPRQWVISFHSINTQQIKLFHFTLIFSLLNKFNQSATLVFSLIINWRKQGSRNGNQWRLIEMEWCRADGLRPITPNNSFFHCCGLFGFAWVGCLLSFVFSLCGALAAAAAHNPRREQTRKANQPPPPN